MKREIKFRGLSDNNDGTTEMVFGDLIHLSECFTTYANTHPHRIAWKVDGRHFNKPVRNKTVGQFTGLTDKYGKEIYEGDVISLKTGHTTDIYGNQIPSMPEFKFFFEFTFRGGAWLAEEESLFDDAAQSKVIGNFYEKPEIVDRVE